MIQSVQEMQALEGIVCNQQPYDQRTQLFWSGTPSARAQ